MPANKTANEYQAIAGQDLFDDTPKAVWAAIANSFAMARVEDRFEDVRAEVLAEWRTLHEQGIVPQPVPRKFI